MKQYTDAITDFDAAIHLKSDNADIYYSRGLAKGILGRFTEEKQDLLIALKLAEQDGDMELIAEIKQDLY